MFHLVRDELKTKTTQSGFTLVELLVVIAVIGLLAGLIGANLGSVRAKARDAQRKSDLKAIQTAIVLYQDTKRTLPTGPADSRSGQPAWITDLSPVYIERVPVDPKNDSTYFYSYVLGAGRQVGAFVLEARLETDGVAGLTDRDTSGGAANFVSGSFKDAAGVVYYRVASGPVSS